MAARQTNVAGLGRTLANIEREAREEAQRNAGAGIRAATVFLAARVKETLSVPAPRKRVTSRKGVVYYVATTPAAAGAPPRKLSGTLRARVGYGFVSATRSWVGVNGLVYAARHEYGTHPFLEPTLRKYEQEVVGIIGAGGQVRR